MSELHYFETMSNISGDMVQAAASGDWDRLVELERNIAELRAALAAAEGDANLSEDERARKVALIKQILADDRAVRGYTEPWMEQIRRYLGDSARGRDLRKTYTDAGY